MGRPIKKKFISSTQTHHIVCTAWVTGDSQARTGVIIRQKTSNEYKVSTQAAGGPSTTKGFLCKLVTGTPTAAGQMSITVDPYQAPTSNATFVVHMEVDTATLGATGSGYSANDVLTVVGGTGSAATLTVDTVDGGGHILTFHVTSAARGDYTVLATNPVSVTGGTGTLATFNLKYRVKSVAVTGGGTGYGANTQGAFTGGGFVTSAVDSVTVNGSNVITAVTVSSPGSGYTSIPTFSAISFGVAQYARKINNRTVETFTSNRYKWELSGTNLIGSGTANTGTTQGTFTLGEALIQSV